MAHSLHSQQPPESKHGEHNAPRKHTSVNALIGFVLVVIAAIFVMSVLFRVHDIRVEGNEHPLWLCRLHPAHQRHPAAAG